MKAKEAIELLQNQKESLKGINEETFSAWRTHTTSLIKDFFGEKSDEYLAASNLSYARFIGQPKLNYERGAIERQRSINIESTTFFLDNCIKKIQAAGLYKQPTKNFMSNKSNGVMWGILITVAIFIAGVIGTCCFQWGKYTSDVQNIELKRQLKAKDDTINGLHHPPVNIEQPVDMHTNKRTAKQSHSTTITNPTFNSPSQIGDGNTQNIK